jgi:peroxiredoxin
VELIRDENGNLMGVSMQSDDNHVQFCEQHPGPDDIG